MAVGRLNKLLHVEKTEKQPFKKLVVLIIQYTNPILW